MPHGRRSSRKSRSPRTRSARSENLYNLEACKIRSKDAVVSNLAVQNISSPRLDMIEYSARQRLNVVNAELEDLKSRIVQLESLTRFNRVEGQSQQLVITGAPLVVRSVYE